jgi:hypothetical protein
VLSLGGCFSFFLIVVEFKLVQQTSALSINLIGHAKDICSFAAALVILHEHFSLVNM